MAAISLILNKMFKPVNPKQDLVKLEQQTTKFWKKNKTFERSIQNRLDSAVYSFFDGPPFITGVPHYGTILSSVAKDVVPRYWTMKGYRVDRRWGWDCHGLPAENLVEKKLNIQCKEQIEKQVGIEKFNQICCGTVSQMADEWEEIIDRVGRWVDFKNAYRTMDKDYMESVWWAFKELHNKGLVYEDTRISLYCPRCETPLSNFEIAMDNSYEETVDASVFVKLKIKSPKYQDNFLLVWTTTPWTLPANTGVAVGAKTEYVRIKTQARQTIILAKDRLEEIQEKYAILEEIKGDELVGLEYEPLYREFEPDLKKADPANLYKVWAADFVSTQEGSGLVHLAPAYGEDDYELAKLNQIPVIKALDSKACYLAGRWQGRDIWQINKKIITDLGQRDLLYKEKPVSHTYPFCYRCKTKLIYQVQPSWYVNIAKIRDDLVEQNKKINWQPTYIKKGRFLKGIESAPDWGVSRDRFWGTALPVWRCEKCDQIKVVGSYKELYQLSGQRLEDYHRPQVDKIDFQCDCGGTYRRVPQVLDVWFDSGSMPYGERHYPFENNDDFTQKFPTDFIAEYVAQTRGWFYVLHVIAVAIFNQPAFKNVVVTGVIAGEDGRKMSKSLGNYTDPVEVLDQHGADALRFYLMSSPIMEAQNINFSPQEIHEVKRGVISTLWNSYSFFVTYAIVDQFDPNRQDSEESIVDPAMVNILDRWILAELNLLIREYTRQMDNYQIAKASRLLPIFIDKLSNWYIRRSRRRFWKSGNSKDKDQAYQTLYQVLVVFSQLAAPLMPFITEAIYQNLTQEESVHLSDFPVADKKLIDKGLCAGMEKARQVVKLALSLRARHQVKVRQPLSRMYVNQKDITEHSELTGIIRDEVNVKKITFSQEPPNRKGVANTREGDIGVSLNIKITPALKQEGMAREIIRHLQSMRRQADYAIDDRIIVNYTGANKMFGKYAKMIANETLADILEPGHLYEPDVAQTIKINNQTVTLEINCVDKKAQTGSKQKTS
ncbi:MAG: isoleucine--tRNA ligase [Candidatus Moranbacteria bacterium]|nr:isoleucine--tRNA ligase [Candidatus Moranbacteria bacterium]